MTGVPAHAARPVDGTTPRRVRPGLRTAARCFAVLSRAWGRRPIREPGVEENIYHVGRVHHGASITLCTPAPLDQTDGRPLGAQAGAIGLTELIKQGGVTHVRRATETPFNLILKARAWARRPRGNGRADLMGTAADERQARGGTLFRRCARTPAVLALTLAATMLAGCDLGSLPVADTTDLQITALSGGSLPTFALVGQSVGPVTLDGAGEPVQQLKCPKPGSVTWTFVDDRGRTASYRQDAGVFDHSLPAQDSPDPGTVGSCVTSADPGHAPRAVLPSAFVNRKVTVYAELRGFAHDRSNDDPAEGNVDNVINLAYVSSGKLDYTPSAPVLPALPRGKPAPSVTELPPSPISFEQPPHSYLTGQAAVGVAAADLHLNSLGAPDRLPDVAVATNVTYPGDNYVYVWPNRGAARLDVSAPAYQLLPGTHPGGIIAANLHANGTPDLAVADQGSPSGGGVTLLTNHGDGTFTAQGGGGFTYQAGAGARAIAADRLTGSAYLDLVTANAAEGDASIFYNGFPAGSFADPITTGTGGGEPSGVVTGDLNADGRPDLVFANTASDTVGVSPNTRVPGFPGFAPAEPISSLGRGPDAVAIGNLNGDPSPDLVVANGAGDSLAILINTTAPTASSFTFNVHTISEAHGSHPVALALGDFNADGHLDIAVANQGTRNVALYAGDGHGEFGPTVVLSTAPHPNALAAADLTGDHADDLLVAAGDPANQLSDGVVELFTSSALVASGSARDRGSHRMRPHPRTRTLTETGSLKASFRALTEQGPVIQLRGVSITGRLHGKLAGPRRARGSLPAGALDLLDVDIAVAGTAQRYFFPPLHNPVIVTGTLLARSRRDHRMLACLRLGASPTRRYGVPGAERMTLIGGTGGAARLRARLTVPAPSFERLEANVPATLTLATGRARGLSPGCRALVKKLPR